MNKHEQLVAVFRNLLWDDYFQNRNNPNIKVAFIYDFYSERAREIASHLPRWRNKPDNKKLMQDTGVWIVWESVEFASAITDCDQIRDGNDEGFFIVCISHTTEITFSNIEHWLLDSSDLIDVVGKEQIEALINQK